jgi:DNA-binding CsgD family transcriptional regulator
MRASLSNSPLAGSFGPANGPSGGRDRGGAQVRALIDLGDVAHDRGDLPLAVERYRACIERIGERGDMRVVADTLTGIVGAATAWGLARPALRLFGAADAPRERVGAALLHPNDIAAAARNLAALGAELGEQAVADLLAEGRALPLAEAVAIAGMVALVAAGRGAAVPPTQVRLTPGELDVLRLLAEWRTDREIAEALFLSPRTVSWHVRAIIAKLGAESRRDGIARARARGLV